MRESKKSLRLISVLVLALLMVIAMIPALPSSMQKVYASSVTVHVHTNGAEEGDYDVTTDDNGYMNAPSVSKIGYGLDGWYEEADFSGTAINFGSKQFGYESDIYAKWTPHTYTVHFEGNGATGGSMTDQAFTFGTEQALSANQFEKDHYNFSGWDTIQAGGGNAYSDEELVSNLTETDGETITLYAQWTPVEYTVTFEANGGTAIEPRTVGYGETVLEPDDEMTREHFTFDGWYKDMELTDPYDFNTPVTENITLYAKWTPDEYTVKFETNGGTTVTDQAVAYLDTAEEPEEPTKEHYTFGGWFTDADLTQAYDFSTQVTEDITLYAKWTPDEYTVKFETNGGTTVDDQTVTYNDAATKPDDPTKAGYDFAGWFADADLTQAYDFSAPVTEDVTLYAKWIGKTHVYVIRPSDKGTITLNPSAPRTGEEVTITVLPNPGYEFGAILVEDSQGNELDVAKTSDGKFVFTQPANDVIILVKYTAKSGTSGSDGKTPAVAASSSGVKTGDSSNAVLWMFLMAAAAGTLAVVRRRIVKR